MAKLTWVGENYDNKGGSSSKAYCIRRAGRDAISKWGPIQVIGGQGGKYYWLGSYPQILRKRFATTKAAAAFVARMIASKEAGYYERLPRQVKIRPAIRH